MKTLITAVTMLVVSATSVGAADLVLSPSPVVQQRIAYYTPSPVAVAAPVTTYYAPQTVTSYYSPQPVTTYYAPSAVAAPVVSTPVTTYYAPSATVVTPVPTVTYYAPTAVTSFYAPTTTYYAPVVTPVVVGRPAVVRSKVYYPYEPVRNFLKAVTP